MVLQVFKQFKTTQQIVCSVVLACDEQCCGRNEPAKDQQERGEYV